MTLQLDAEDEADGKLLQEASKEEWDVIVERQARRRVQKEGIAREQEVRVENIASETTNAWTALMQAMRRAEGIKSARQIFARARKANPLSHHIFVASGTTAVDGGLTTSIDGVS